MIFIAVGTPSNNDETVNLDYVKNVANSISTHINGYKVIINKSTVPPGTGELVKKLISKADIITQNFRPGVIERIGLDYENVKKIKRLKNRANFALFFIFKLLNHLMKQYYFFQDMYINAYLILH